MKATQALAPIASSDDVTLGAGASSDNHALVADKVQYRRVLDSRIEFTAFAVSPGGICGASSAQPPYNAASAFLGLTKLVRATAISRLALTNELDGTVKSWYAGCNGKDGIWAAS